MLRKCTAQEDGTGVPAPSLAYQEDDILAAFQACLHLAEVVLVIYRLLVDLKDHIATTQTGILSERIRLNILNDHALARLGSQPIGKITGERPHGHPQLAFGRLGLVVRIFVIAQAVPEKLGSVSDGDRSLTGFSVAQVADL